MNKRKRQIVIIIALLILLAATIAVRHRIAESRKQSESKVIVCAWRIDDEEETEDASICFYSKMPEEMEK